MISIGIPITNPVDAAELQIYRSALKLTDFFYRASRTRRAAELRSLCIQHLVFGDPPVEIIARRTKRTRRRVFQALREARFHCPSISLALTE
jgi:hypothetical protein